MAAAQRNRISHLCHATRQRSKKRRASLKEACAGDEAQRPEIDSPRTCESASSIA